MQCPKCNSDVWDNRQKKASGQFKANAPDFSCKNKSQCGWTSYPERGAAVAPQPHIPPQPVAPFVAPSPVDNDAKIVALYWNCLDTIMAGVAQRKLTEYFKSENIVAMTAALYIQRAKG